VLAELREALLLTRARPTDQIANRRRVAKRQLGAETKLQAAD
jgi:hypothetical protein